MIVLFVSAAPKMNKSAAPSGSVTATQQVASCADLLAVKDRKNNFAQKGKLSFLRLSSRFFFKNISRYRGYRYSGTFFGTL